MQNCTRTSRGDDKCGGRGGRKASAYASGEDDNPVEADSGAAKRVASDLNRTKAGATGRYDGAGQSPPQQFLLTDGPGGQQPMKAARDGS